MRLRQGVDEALEAAADALLKEQLNKITKHSAKADVLTSWKMRDRQSHEILVSQPDPSVLQGVFSRVYDHDSGTRRASREGVSGLRRRIPGPFSAYLEEHGNVRMPSGAMCTGYHHMPFDHCTSRCANSRGRS